MAVNVVRPVLQKDAIRFKLQSCSNEAECFLEDLIFFLYFYLVQDCLLTLLFLPQVILATDKSTPERGDNAGFSRRAGQP